MISIEVTKNPHENSVNLIRRFTRKVKGSGILQNVRGKRFFSRKLSTLKSKGRALDGLQKRDYYARLRKLGKVS